MVMEKFMLFNIGKEDLIKFLKLSKEALKQGGAICIKENISRQGFIVDNEDSSVTRSDQHFKYLFKQAGLKLIQETFQKVHPEFLFKVKMYALR
jgi:protein N-terminal methyltransferase